MTPSSEWIHKRAITMTNYLHIPPVWLVFCIFLAWCQGRYMPLGMSVDHPVTHMMAGLMIGAGVLLMLAALVAFRRHKTTVIPHQTPEKLITDGVFARTRNPIYLGDALVLAGLILRFDAVPSLVLVPVFVWWIERQFIIPEEDRMRRVFRAEFARYEQKVRRWV
ncbi:isoprenylcysteine carboxylmethyltransferase family protein [uncultured Tateyamaria sp.]|uniref:methyltransferase family protein n=1 Tax=uncultured Tateyamaria sp. TaxID=455651 RepID=UPI00261B781C|nr:isoprenylcysteine carboxylmethyltransferase family protein [uncultured Tateyamaria sp.]